MSATGTEAFDKTLHITNVWLDEIMADHGPDRQVAWHILSAVLRATRDRLPVDLAAHLGAQLPILIRGAYYDQFVPSRQPVTTRSRDEFLEKVGENLSGTRPINTTEAVKSVFKVLNHHVDPGQVTKVREALPEDVRNLWPQQARDDRLAS